MGVAREERKRSERGGVWSIRGRGRNSADVTFPGKWKWKKKWRTKRRIARELLWLPNLHKRRRVTLICINSELGRRPLFLIFTTCQSSPMSGDSFAYLGYLVVDLTRAAHLHIKRKGRQWRNSWWKGGGGEGGGEVVEGGGVATPFLRFTNQRHRNQLFNWIKSYFTVSLLWIFSLKFIWQWMGVWELFSRDLD